MTMNSYDIADIAPESGQAWKPEIGDTVRGTIVWVGDSVRPNFDKTGDERSLRVDLDTGDRVVSVYAVTCNDMTIDEKTGKPKGYPSRLARAIAGAVRTAGSQELVIGATLAVKRVEDVPTKMSPAKDFKAKYEPPVVAAGVAVDFDEPAPAPKPAAVDAF